MFQLKNKLSFILKLKGDNIFKKDRYLGFAFLGTKFLIIITYWSSAVLGEHNGNYLSQIGFVIC